MTVRRFRPIGGLHQSPAAAVVEAEAAGVEAVETAGIAVDRPWAGASTAVDDGVTGAGPAVLSRLAVTDDLDRGRLVEVATQGVDLTRLLRAVWVDGRRPSPPAQDLLRIASAPPGRSRR